MSDDKNQQSRNAARPAGMEPIRVQELRFCVKDGRDIPLPGIGVNGGKDIIRSGALLGGELAIEWKPWLRHHHLRYTQGTKLVSECFVHESWVAWTPYTGEAP